MSFQATQEDTYISNMFGSSQVSDNSPGQYSVEQWSDLITEAATKYNIDPNLIRAVMKQESGGNPNAVSSAGAEGLMQIMPPTSKWLGVTNPLDPRENIFGGAKYLDHLLRGQGDDVDRTLAAYNGGPSGVSKAVKQYGDDWFNHLHEFKGVNKRTGENHAVETRKYLQAINSQGGLFDQFSTQFPETQEQGTIEFQPEEEVRQEGVGELSKREDPAFDIMKRLGQAWGGSVAGLQRGLGGAAELTHIPGIKEFGQFISEDAEETAKFYKVENPKLFDQLASGVASGLQFLVPSVGIAKSAAVIGLLGNTANAAKIASWLGIGANAVVEAATEAGNTYNNLQEKEGVEDKEATLRSLASFSVNLAVLTATNVWGGLFAPNVKAGTSLVKKVAVGSGKLAKEMGGEAIQEGFQEATSAVAEDDFKELTKPTVWRRIGLSAGLGGVTAGIIHPMVAISAAQEAKRADQKKPVKVAETVQQETQGATTTELQTQTPEQLVQQLGNEQQMQELGVWEHLTDQQQQGVQQIQSTVVPEATDVVSETTDEEGELTLLDEYSAKTEGNAPVITPDTGKKTIQQTLESVSKLDDDTVADVLKLTSEGWVLEEATNDGSVILTKVDSDGNKRSTILQGFNVKKSQEEAKPVNIEAGKKQAAKVAAIVKSRNKPEKAPVSPVEPTQPKVGTGVTKSVSVPSEGSQAPQELTTEQRELREAEDRIEKSGAERPDKYVRIAKELDILFNGIQRSGFTAIPDMLYFTSKASGRSTFAVHIEATKEEIAEAMNDRGVGKGLKPQSDKKTTANKTEQDSKTTEEQPAFASEKALNKLEKELFNEFGTKATPNAQLSKLTVAKMRDRMTDPDGSFRLSENAVAEFSDRTIERFRDMVARVDGGISAVAKRIKRSQETQATGYVTRKRNQATLDKISLMEKIQGGKVKFNENNKEHVKMIKQGFAEQIGDTGVLLLTIDQTFKKAKQAPGTKSKSGVDELSDLKVGMSGNTVDFSKVEQTKEVSKQTNVFDPDNSFLSDDFGIIELGEDNLLEDSKDPHIGHILMTRKGKTVKILGNTLSPQDLKNDLNFDVVHNYLRTKLSAQELKKYGITSIQNMVDGTSGTGRVHSAFIKQMYSILVTDKKFNFNKFKTRIGFKKYIDVVHAADKLQDHFVDKAFTDTDANQRKKIEQAVKDKHITYEQGEAWLAILASSKNVPDFKLNFGSDIKTSSFGYVANILSVKNGRPFDFAHEFGHWAFYNVLTSQDRYKYYTALEKKYFGKGGINTTKMTKNLVIPPAQSNVLDSAAEYFAEQVMQYAHFNVINESQHRSLVEKVYDTLAKFWHEMKSRLYVDPITREYMDKIFVSREEKFALSKKGKQLIDQATKGTLDMSYNTLMFTSPLNPKDPIQATKKTQRALTIAGIRRLANQYALRRETNIKNAQAMFINFAVVDMQLEKQDLTKNFLRTVKNIKKIGDANWKHSIGVVENMVNKGIKTREINGIVKVLKGTNLDKLSDDIKQQVDTLLRTYDFTKMTEKTEERLKQLELELYNINDPLLSEEIKKQVARLKKNPLVSEDVETVLEVSAEIKGLLHEDKQRKKDIQKQGKLEREFVAEKLNKSLVDIQEKKSTKKLKKTNKKLGTIGDAIQGNKKAHGIKTKTVRSILKSAELSLNAAEVITNYLDGGKHGDMTQEITQKLLDANAKMKEYRFKAVGFISDGVVGRGINLTGWSRSEFSGFLEFAIRSEKRNTELVDWKLEAGTTLILTKMERIGIYRAAKDMEGLRHLLNGGIAFQENNEPFKVSVNDLTTLVNSVTKEELKFSGLMDEFFWEQKQTVNAHSNKTLGYSLIQKDDNYHPLLVRGENVSHTTTESTNIATINERQRNNVIPGVLRARSAKASQPIIIEDALQALTRSATSVGHYISHSTAIKEVGNALNDVKATMSQLGLQEEYKELEMWFNREALSDNTALREGGFNKMITSLQKLFAVGKLGFRLPVQAVQSLSAVLYFTEPQNVKFTPKIGNAKYLNEMLHRLSDSNVNFKDRFEGNIDRDLAELLKSSDARAIIKSSTSPKPLVKFVKKWLSAEGAMSGISMMDATALAIGGTMVEEKMLSEGKEKGTEAFEEELGRRAWESTRRTQPIFDRVSRGRLHSSTGLAKLVTIFGSQRAQNYMITKRAFSKIANGNTKDGVKDLALVHMLAPLVIMIIKESWRLARGKEDDRIREWTHWAKYYTTIELGNILGLGAVVAAMIGNYDVPVGSYGAVYSDFKRLVTSIQPKNTRKGRAEQSEKILRAAERLAGDFGVAVEGPQEYIDFINHMAKLAGGALE